MICFKKGGRKKMYKKMTVNIYNGDEKHYRTQTQYQDPRV